MPVPSFTAAMKNYFGLNGKSITDFARELKELSYLDKLYYHRLLTDQAGVTCELPPRPAGETAAS